MKSVEQRAQTLEVFGAYRNDRLQGGNLSKAHGDGYSFIVAYRRGALKFDAVVAHVGRTITGAQLLTMAVREPESSKDFYLTLKSRKGVISWRSLNGTELEEYGDLPDEAILAEDEELDPDAEAVFTPEDEKRFQKLHSMAEQRKIPMGGGVFGIPPQQPGRKP